MAIRLPRRKRLLLFTTGAALGFMALAAAAAWLALSPASPYRGGDTVEGLTRELERPLPGDPPGVVFEDVTATAGISFRHFAGRRSSQLPEDMGSGAAWGDYDNDGWLDLYVVNTAGPLTRSPDAAPFSPARSTLYHNNGDGTFREVAEEAGVSHGGMGMAAAWADYDNDGWIDLVVTVYGQNVLYHNNGNGSFTDVAATAGLGTSPGFWTGASWADFNRDGFLDLYITGYVRYVSDEAAPASLQYDVAVPSSINPSSFDPERNLLYRNNRDGTFTEMAQEAGVAGREGRSLAATWSDLDEDGWPDLYVANDVSDNVLYRNIGNGFFEDISHRARVADYRGAMGIAVGDWDGDADMDLFVTHWIAQENALYNNKLTELASGNPGADVPLQFMDEADRNGLGQIALDFVGWGTSFFDYDNDGWLDLLVVNGSTFQDKETPYLLVGMRDQLFWSRGPDEGFFEVGPISGTYFHQALVGRGAALADYDEDGDVDVFIVNNGGPGILLRNDGGNRHDWLKVRLRGRESNSAAIGARLELAAGARLLVREIGSQSSYLSQNSWIAHFGLGSGGEADSLTIRWPSGRRQVIRDLVTNRTLDVTEPESDS